MMNPVFQVALGGALGATARHGVNVGAARLLGPGLPFSAFSLDVVVLWQKGQGGMAALYVAASVLLSIAALGAGLAVGRPA